MASVRVDTAPLIAGACVVSAYPGHGIRGDAVPQTGLHGASILWGTGGNISLPAEAADEFRLLVLTRPAGLPGLVIGEDGSIEVPEDSPAGTHTGTWRGHKNAVVFGPDPSTYTIVIGGGVLSGDAQLAGPDSSGALTGGAPTVLSGAAAIGAVAASGALASVPASTLSGAAVLGGIGCIGWLGKAIETPPRAVVQIQAPARSGVLNSSPAYVGSKRIN